ncbi:endolytic transglycosylase MltG [Glaciecola petra]|uniref:Endolytic murein transglycosylase n=1 Tax=Glaciecola petra TaxID=3075602 RepID=A0ABU2ZNX9_9ALTE|nr:endolytic transglycosylase MltG [Aestuariibacter sp. P117]MDT0594328.1 endolytic transglycosylase MltG [Aestuariibacter sp. P117]
MKRFILITIVSIVVMSLCFLFVGYTKVTAIDNTILNNQTPLLFEIKPGSSVYSVKQRLTEYAKVDSIGFKLWLRLNPEVSSIKAGMYELPPNANFTELMSMFALGQEKQFSITLVEGDTIANWLAQIALLDSLQNDVRSANGLYQYLVTDGSFCENDYQSIEGCLLPDTYFYTHNDLASSVFTRSYKAMESVVKQAWQDRYIDTPITDAYELLVLASIIEKETALSEERGEIAGVFSNRLERNMRLQTDPTVIYGVGEDYDGDITRLHLRTPTPYNTYIIKGLPITPISMPSRASINAAARPDITDNLYFVASGSGGHVFSQTLADHNKAVRQYLETLNNKQ